MTTHSSVGARSWMWRGGAIRDAAEPVWAGSDRVALYGDGLFETIRVAAGRAIELAAHLERLTQSARALGYPAEEAVESEAREAVAGLLQYIEERQASHPAGVLRLTLSRGAGGFGFAPGDEMRPHLAAHWFDLPSDFEARRGRGVRVWIAEGLSPGVFARHKTCSALVYVEARRRARALGYDDALLEDGEGGLAEASAANLFAVLDGRIVTPPTRLPLLPGIARRRVMEIAPGGVEERPIFPTDLDQASELFLTNSVYGVVPVIEARTRAIGTSAPGPVTHSLSEALEALWR